MDHELATADADFPGTLSAMFAHRHWIPPGALIFAQTAHGTSWVLLAIVAWYGQLSAPSGLGLAWIHTVALGWLTMAALGILIHVIPGFTDVRFAYQNVARYALLPFALGVLLFVVGWIAGLQLMAIGAFTIAVASVCYVVVSAQALAQAPSVGKREASIARALTINLTFFLVTTVLGATMAAALAYGWFARTLAYLPAIHANIALYGWLTMLVYGVSVRTMRPICGAQSRIPRLHIIVGSSVLIGPILVALGVVLSPALTWIGALLLGAGTIAYASDALDVVRRATVPHRPPQAFAVAAVVWLVLSSVLALGVMLGKPWAPAYLFVLLVGWIGQMVNAHVLHIGVRLIATIVRGDDDETRLGILLDARLSWSAFAAMQLAVVLAAAGLIAVLPTVVAIGAGAGFVGWLSLLANAMVARSRAYSALSRSPSIA
jgi:hypothetical protein